MAANLDEAHLRAELQRRFGLGQEGLEVDTGPSVPGVLVFHAYNRASAHNSVTGTFDGRLHTEFDESLQLVLTALGFGEHEVDPVVVAGAVGKLEGNPGSPLLDEFALQESGDPATMSLPHSVVVDGHPGVEYWNMTSRRPPWRSRVLRLADGTFVVRQDLPEAR